MNRFIVCGAPCAGKSSFVRDRAVAGDLIYDYDSIHQALSGLGSHRHLDEIRPYVIAARDAVFHLLEAHCSQAAFVITSSPSKAEIERLSDRFEADIVFLGVSAEDAHRRADFDERPSEWHQYIDNWFERSDLDWADPDPDQKGRWSVMKTKTFNAPLVLKEGGDPGEFQAVFASLNVIDHDGDVTIPGAFREGQECIVEPWNHGWDLPAGKGVIHSDQKSAWIDGRFFMETEVGLENYKTVKAMGSLAEWSYTFQILEAADGEFESAMVQFLKGLDVVGVSPVTRGAGIETHTVAIKRKKSAIASHSTATSDVAWDGPANETRVKSGEGLPYYRRIYAWRDPDGDPAVKSTYRFIHHEIDGDGNPGAANVRACQTGIGVLNGARGGTTIPAGDRDGVYTHLARHLRDADVEPPELKSLEDANRKGENSEGETAEGKPSDELLAQIDLIELTVITSQTGAEK